MANKDTYDVFISYSHSDAPIAKTIANKLRSHDLATFVHTDVHSGGKNEGTIWEAMAESRVLIAIIPDGPPAPWMSFEIGAATAWDKPIFAVASSPTLDQWPGLLRSRPTYSMSDLNDLVRSVIETAKPLSDTDKDRLFDAYVRVGVPVDRLIAQPRELTKLTKLFNKAGGRKVAASQLMSLLLRSRKQGKLPKLSQYSSKGGV